MEKVRKPVGEGRRVIRASRPVPFAIIIPPWRDAKGNEHPAFAIELDPTNLALLDECHEDHPGVPLHQLAHMLWEYDGM